MTETKATRAADSSEPAGSSTCNDGDLLSVAAHGLRCAFSWEPGARIIGNCRSADLRKIFAEYIALKSPKTALTSDQPNGPICGNADSHGLATEGRR
jgi:hypothetical protein